MLKLSKKKQKLNFDLCIKVLIQSIYKIKEKRNFKNTK